MQYTAEYLDSQRETAQSMQPARSLQVMARLAISQLHQLIPCRQASLIKFDRQAGAATILATYTIGEPPREKGTRLPLEVLALAPEIWQGEVHLTGNLLNLSNPSRALQALQAEGVRCYLSVPIVGHPEDFRPAKAPILGCLNIGADTPDAFTPEHIHWACEVASMMAVAIGQAVLYQQAQHQVNELEQHLAERTAVETELISSVQAADEQLQQKAKEQQQLEAAVRRQAQKERLSATISQQSRHASNLRETLNTAASEVREALQADRVLIYRFAEDWSGSMVVESLASGWISMLGFSLREPCLSSEQYLRRYQRGRFQAIEDTSTVNLEPAHFELLEFFGIKSQLIVPLLVGEELRINAAQKTLDSQPSNSPSKLWGLLIAHQCESSRQWQPFEIDLLTSVTTQLEIAIQQSRLCEKVRQLNADLVRQVEDCNEQLQQVLEFEAMLQRITDKACDSLDETQILQTAVKELAEVLGVEECSSAVYSADRTTVTLCHHHSTSPPSSLRSRPMADFPQVYCQLLQGKEFQFCQAGSNNSQGNSAILACPISHGDEVLGDLWLFKQPEDNFNALEIRLVQLVTHHCAIALRQARLYQSAQSQVTELAKLNELKDDFLSTVSHELRTPLSNMKMAIQMLAISLNQETGFFAELTKPEAERSKLARYFQIVRNECEREIHLINDLLELQQLDAGSQTWAPAIIQLQRLIPQIVEPFEDQTRNCQQVLQLEMSPDLPDLFGDPSILKRVLAELLTNACKYTPAGEQITVEVAAVGDRVQFSVTNSGAEIPPEELNNIFKKFYRIPKADRWQQGGTGLGLAVVHKLTERLGGTIQVKSEAGQTCFTVDLPINGPSQTS
ncbi:MAG: GAF domain-containing protein [Microcoleus vaginatus WJT46-NPBG5]|jgi:signal transduction histidine kinase|nr:GAF domain-containing protein [Microcoleus vaginatus WJT46-NPBG5]